MNAFNLNIFNFFVPTPTFNYSFILNELYKLYELKLVKIIALAFKSTYITKIYGNYGPRKWLRKIAKKNLPLLGICVYFSISRVFMKLNLQNVFIIWQRFSTFQKICIAYIKLPQKLKYDP